MRRCSNMHVDIALLSIVWIHTIFIPDAVTAAACITGCTCSELSSKSGSRAGRLGPNPRIKVVCHPSNQFTRIEELDFGVVPNAVQLDLSKNSLTVLPKGAFHLLPYLEKLDLSSNQISVIEPAAFLNLTRLQKLDLSDNQLSRINGSILRGLTGLLKLSLSRNQLTTLPEGSFIPLPQLKRIDFQSPRLICDCLLSWIKDTSVIIKPNTVCTSPAVVKGRTLKSLKKKDLQCGWPLELPTFEMTPSSNQVVFQGDKLPFQCRASVLDKSTQIVWVRNGQAVHENKSAGIYVHTQYSLDRKTIINSLILEHLSLNNSGIWQCMVQTAKGNISQNVNIIVISKAATFCSPMDVDTNKGFYQWPKTVGGVIMTLPCQKGPAARYKHPTPAKAVFRCSEGGVWRDLDVSQCQYRNEMTRVLQQWTMMNLNNLTSVVSKANKLNSYMTAGRVLQIQDKMDVIYISQIIEKFSKQVFKYPQLADIIVDLVSRMMNAADHLLRLAQVEDHACSRMVKSVEDIPKQLLIHKRFFSIHSSNIAMEAHEVAPLKFGGMTCAVLHQSVSGYGGANSLKCNANTNSSKTAVTASNQEMEASISIPASVFRNLHCPYNNCGSAVKLQFIVYKTAALFPSSSLSKVVTTPVISSRIVGVAVQNLSESIVIHLRSRRIGAAYQGVYWDFSAYGGQGGWVGSGCQLQYHRDNLSCIHCNHLTNFAVLQSSLIVRSLVLDVDWLIVFRLQPAVYVGSCVCVVCLLAVIITYATSHRLIQIPKKLKHSLVGVCMSVLLGVATFTLGIHLFLAASSLYCQMVGIAIHYFSLSTLFWITITTSNMYKKFTKVDRPSTDPPPDALNPMPPKPMLRFYLLGWGVPIIICGITAAVNIQHYTSQQYCFLLWEPSLGAFYGPVLLLVVINCFLFLRLSCVLRGSSLVADETETEEINELELTGPEPRGSLAHTNRTSATSKSSLMDAAYRPITQMRAVAMLLFLYMLVWTCAAFTVADPLQSMLPYREVIFSYAYGFTSSLLGVFVLMFFCLGRSDARAAWQKVFCCEKRHAVYDVNRTNGGHMTHANGHVIQSASSLDSSFTNKSNNTNKSVSYRNAPPLKQSNINILPLRTLSVTDHSLTSIQENFPSFYNPRQNGVAKKFWEKSRQKNGHRKLLNKNLNIDSGHSSQGDGRSQSELKRNSFGGGNNSNSDTGANNILHSAEMHRNLDVQNSADVNSAVPSRPFVRYSPLTVQTNFPLGVAMTDKGAIYPQNHRSPVGVLVDPVRLSPGGIFFDRNHISPVGVIVDPIMMNPVGTVVDHDKISPYMGPPPPVMASVSPPKPSVPVSSLDQQSGGGSKHSDASNHIPQLSPYMLPPPPKPSYPVFRSNTLPHPSRPPSVPNDVVVNQFMQRNGSVPRLRDFDGQSQFSQETPPRPISTNNSLVLSGVSKDAENLPYVLPMWTQMLSRDHTNAEVNYTMPLPLPGNQTQPQTTNTSNNNNITNHRLSQCSQDSHHTADSSRPHTPPPLPTTVQTQVPPPPLPAENGRHKKSRSRGSKRDSFLEQIEQRIPPQNNRAHSPSASDSQGADRSGEYENLPLRHKRRHHRSHDPHHRPPHGRRHSRNLSRSSTNSKNWDEEFRHHIPKVSYAYVNHRYQQKLMHKFQKQQHVNGFTDAAAAAKGFWFPRSVSAYEQVANDILSNLDDDGAADSLSSSDDSDNDDIWVLQNEEEKDKGKKETSV